MTPAKSGPTNVVVVDGSNIATEGRSVPSLSQLNDAVMAFTEEFPDATITVVVDATFGHRIDKKELAEFDAAVAHNELVAPPAGAIGRGDAFVLSIANKVGARILSNDSFQEFHGDYPWLFDEGRLIGGKPVPFVGWVFVERLPVKGPVSRKATRSSRSGGREREPRAARRTASREASLPMPVPTVPPPGRRGRGHRSAVEQPVPVDAVVVDGAVDPVPTGRQAAPSGGGPVNDLLPFLEFVEHHPVGSSVNGVVESYSSHGAYVMIGDLRGYVPLRLMGDPPPRSAREVMKLDDAVTLVVTSFAPARRSVDLAIPKLAPVTDVAPMPALEDLAASIAPVKPARKRAAKKAAARPVEEPGAVITPGPESVSPAPEAAPPKRRSPRRTAAATPVEEVAAPAGEPVPDVAPTKRAARTKRFSAKSAGPVEQAPSEQAAPAPVEQVAATKATKKTTKKAAAAAKAKAAPAKKAPAKRAAKKAAARPAPEA